MGADEPPISLRGFPQPSVVSLSGYASCRDPPPGYLSARGAETMPSRSPSKV